jgi:hypothetical protein
MVAMEHKAGLRQTRAFIKRNPIDVVFARRPREVTSAGGHKEGAPQNLAAQRVRMVPARTETRESPQRTTPDGQLVTPNFYLIGLDTFDVAVNDRCEVDGRPLRVVYVNAEPKWRIIAEVVEESHGQ